MLSPMESHTDYHKLEPSAKKSTSKIVPLIGWIVAAVLLIVLIITMIIHDNHHDDCEDTEFIGRVEQRALAFQDHAAVVVGNQHPDVNPCDDFYEYSCGGYMDTHAISAQKDRQMNLLMNLPILTKTITDIMHEHWPVINGLYKSCLSQANTDGALNKYGLDDLVTEIENMADASSVMQITGKLHRLNFAWTYSIGKNGQKNSGMFTPIVDQPLERSSTKHYLALWLLSDGLFSYGSDDDIESFIETQSVLNITANYHPADHKSFFSQVIRFVDNGVTDEAIATRYGNMFALEKTLMTLVNREAEMQEMSPTTNTTFYAESYLNDYFTSLGHDNIRVLGDPDSLIKPINHFHNVLGSISTADKQSVKDLFLFQAMANAQDGLPISALNGTRYHPKTVFSNDADKNEDVCSQYVDIWLGSLVDHHYVTKVLKAEDEVKAAEMVDSVIQAWLKVFEEHSDWLTKSTRNKCIAKLKDIQTKVGHAKYWASYEGLQMFETDLLKNLFTAGDANIRYLFDVAAMEFFEPGDYFLGSNTQSIDAYYNPIFNDITIQISIIAPPIFSAKYPMSFNFGALGAVIGHEIGHAFDDEGRQYDKYGLQEPWWPDSEVAKFNQRTECLIDQASSFPIKAYPGGNKESYLISAKQDGKKTLGENIADNGGLRASIIGYEIYRKAHPEIDWKVEDAATKEAYNLSNDHLPFMAWSQAWCYTSSESNTKFYLKRDVHANYEFRAYSTTRNHEKFTRTFGCQEGDRYYVTADSTCRVW